MEATERTDDDDGLGGCDSSGECTTPLTTTPLTPSDLTPNSCHLTDNSLSNIGEFDTEAEEYQPTDALALADQTQQ